MIEETWAELGKKIECFENRVLVRTTPISEKIGLIYLPTKLSSFYGRLQGQYQMCYAVVLQAGSDATVKPGETVVFTRLAFANLYKMKDNTLVGFVDEDHIELAIEPENENGTIQENRFESTLTNRSGRIS